MTDELFVSRIEIRKEIAQFLADARTASGLSISEASRRAESISAAEISDYETGRKPLPSDHLFRLAKVFNVPSPTLHRLLARISGLKGL